MRTPTPPRVLGCASPPPLLEVCGGPPTTGLTVWALVTPVHVAWINTSQGAATGKNKVVTLTVTQHQLPRLLGAQLLGATGSMETESWCVGAMRTNPHTGYRRLVPCCMWQMGVGLVGCRLRVLHQGLHLLHDVCSSLVGGPVPTCEYSWLATVGEGECMCMGHGAGRALVCLGAKAFEPVAAAAAAAAADVSLMFC